MTSEELHRIGACIRELADIMRGLSSPPTLAQSDSIREPVTANDAEAALQLSTLILAEAAGGRLNALTLSNAIYDLGQVLSAFHKDSLSRDVPVSEVLRELAGIHERTYEQVDKMMRLLKDAVAPKSPQGSN